MKLEELQSLLLKEIPQRIKLKIAALSEEQEQYAADEIVELAEEILNQISAVGICYYLKSNKQKEAYNDFLLQLFNSSGHDYNAGPIYRWTANMIKELGDEMPDEHYSIFWKDGHLNADIHHLALLRNEVMHGFFVLPPERNIKEAIAIADLLNRLLDSKMFNQKGGYHFLNDEGFTGQWNITDEAQWQFLQGDHPFGNLCQRIMQERAETFWQIENRIFENAKPEAPLPVKQFIEKNSKGAFAVWVHPNDEHASDIYSSTGAWLKQQKDTFFVGYQLHEKGLSYTGGFLLNRLIHVLNSRANENAKSKKLEEVVKKLRAESANSKVIVLINQIHIAMFSPQHVTRLSNFLYENEILVVAIGSHFEHFNGFFNSSFTIEHPRESPAYPEAVAALHNYLRFKGPSKDRSDEKADVIQLEQILENVLAELNKGQALYARRFADDHGYDMEDVHEIFALLHPWVNSRREAFEADTVDELYGFPSTMTEVTPIYLALGRRDLKLEYQHKLIYI